MAIARIASIPGTMQYKLAGGKSNTYSGVLAPAVAKPYNRWTQIISDTPGITPFIGDTGPARYLWYKPVVDSSKVASGEIAYFYRRVRIDFPTKIILQKNIGAHISIYADSAFLGRIYLFITDGKQGLSSVKDIYGGPLVLSQSLTETAPFNWQKVYDFGLDIYPYYSLGESTLVIFEIELKVMNYQASPSSNTFNPAGFIYDAAIDGFPEGSTLVNSNDANPIVPLD